MSTHNICFYGEISKIIPKLSSNSHFLYFLWPLHSALFSHYVHRSISSFQGVQSVLIWAAAWQNQKNDVCPVKIQVSLGIRPVWSEFLLSAWRNLGFLVDLLRLQRRLWSVSADVPADLSHTGCMSFCWFCHAAAHFLFTDTPVFNVNTIYPIQMFGQNREMMTFWPIMSWFFNLEQFKRANDPGMRGVGGGVGGGERREEDGIIHKSGIFVLWRV